MSVAKMATYSMQRLDAALLWLCLTGVGISYYAYVVETNKEKDHDYQPFCDISEHVSCTKAFMSDYGKGFGLIPKNSPLHLPNSIFGIIFYTVVASLSLFNNYWNTVLMLVASIMSNLFSLYLARVLYLLRDVCVVCVATYVLNALILVLTVKKLREIKAAPSKKRKTK
ncbi:vitamin K epoxide reductase complex subunit 1-like protein 1 [Phymastichus coffea]|uniref:vitamin K epoxide reductase complex subunit 1-like protein 1 n=1 Tax=Phymastichus coffea TaxID=108790 RepID=UPI00273BC65B|nr:vitamin K epoxide reductase complex subunit 1-like protein 1 [Phymastichus coffea]